MRCDKCGARFGAEETFCPECGIRVKGSSPGGEPHETKAVEAPPAGPGVPQAGPPVPPAHRVGAPKEAKTSGLAVASMVLGIVGLLICPLIASILAFVFGLVARGEIKKSVPRMKGGGMATAGITLGIIGIAIPIILVSVLVPIGVIFIKPEMDATAKLLDGAEAARIYYFEHGNSYEGMRDIDLERIDEAVDFRMAPGRAEEAVYVDNVTARSVRLYCYSSRGNKYTATARGDEWRYGFRYWHRSSRWLEDRYDDGLFE